MANFSTETKVGLFVIIGVIILAYMTTRLEKFQFVESPSYQIWTIFDNAMGLKKNAPIEMAGIQIGLVNKIELEHGRAKIFLHIKPEVKLTIDSSVYICTRGVLGDKYISIEPGSPWAPLIADGEELPKAKTSNEGLEQIITKIGTIIEDFKDITSSLRISVASPESQQNLKETLNNLHELTSSLKIIIIDNQDRLSRVIKNIENFSIDLVQLTNKNKKIISEIVKKFLATSRHLESSISGITSIIEKVDQGEGSLGILLNERETAEKIKSTLNSLNQITYKINEGKGTIGKLINDETTAVKIDEALTEINEYLTKADAWRININYRGDFMVNNSGLCSTFNLMLQPKTDKFYLLGIVNDSIGHRIEKITTTTYNMGNQYWEFNDKIVQLEKDTLKINVELGKRFDKLTIRAGLLASSGGLGIDYYLLNDKLKLSFEGYDFKANNNPHLRTFIDYNFWKYFFITTGIDNFLANSDNIQFFLGAGLTFYDDDLKFLLTNVPSF